MDIATYEHAIPCILRTFLVFKSSKARLDKLSSNTRCLHPQYTRHQYLVCLDQKNCKMGARKVSLETSPLLQSDRRQSTISCLSAGIDGENVTDICHSELSRNSRIATICVLMIGVFIANVDTSLVLATNTVIASSFSQLGSASWLTTSKCCCPFPYILEHQVLNIRSHVTLML